ncbi:acyl-CoA dehydrogenase family protein [Nocardia cyriacigeorgica]|uniref:acyl-CoA dehydrogenase family protein n=1 Tax=Nocardia cyriacigeorgica TaxID=135487 RepID=UPI001895D83D|nr:acyl-CoA dehydrogenase [Nocardia cyriacigeorgica]MBF6087413.1 acyl-CoA dehydrogenase family protein [Nocardia cyriacigeorgica]MBF6092657.1 acyl-CoA dehydrogenase family protein [Nocardia cyriacigeorgica]
MRFALSPEHVDFAASIRKLLDAGKTPAAVRSWAAGEHAAGRALLEQLAGAGVFGLAVAEEFEGIGAEPIDLVVAFGELGRTAVPGPVVESAAVIPALLQTLAGAGVDGPAGSSDASAGTASVGSGAADAAARWLPGIAAGTTLGTIAFATPGRGAVALDADVADLILIADGDRLHTGKVGEQVRSVDPARRLFAVVPDELITEGAHVADAIAAGFDAGALAAAAQLLGAGSGLLDAATEYAKQRKQFGRPIGEFQAVKQKLADVLIALDLAEPLLHRAALTAGGPDRARDVSAALVACGNAAHLAARTGLQVHGAIGYTAEYDLSLLLTKVTALRSAWGTADFHRARIAAALRSGSSAGATA